MLNSDQRAAILFMDEKAIELPVARRIKVYHGIADLIEHHPTRKLFLKKARILETAEKRCLSLRLDFTSPTHNHEPEAR